MDRDAHAIAFLLHEFRNCVASVHGCAQTLREREPGLRSDQREALLDIILKQSDRLDWLTRAASSMDGGLPARAAATRDLASIVRDAAVFAGVDVVLDLTDDAPVAADEVRLGLALEAAFLALRAGDAAATATLGQEALEIRSTARDLLQRGRVWKVALARKLLREEGCRLVLRPDPGGDDGDPPLRFRRAIGVVSDPGVRVLVVDDHEITRQGIRLTAEAVVGVEVVGEAGTGTDAVRLCRELAPDLVLMDLDMPEMDGVEATRRLKEESPDTTVLVLTVHDDEEAAIAAIRAGASGFVPKSSSVAEIRTALDALKSGQTYIPSTSGVGLLRYLREAAGGLERDAPRAQRITERERQILVLLAHGLSARQIGKNLGISERTVNTHVGSVYRKLGVNNRIGAVRAAVRAGLVELPR